MFGFLTGRKKRNRAIADILYKSCIAQTRDPSFYTNLGVPDTLDGRFEILCLHVVLLIERLKQCSEDRTDLEQALFDAMFYDVEDNLRELGIGDLGVPKHMKKMMQGFNGRAIHYDKALKDDTDAQMYDALKRNVYGTLEEEDIDPQWLEILSDYVRHCHYALIQQDDVAVENGHIQFSSLPPTDTKNETRQSA